jgi:hypothetical protein
MPWPDSQEYNEAVQSPTQFFVDSELRQSVAVVDALGLPRPCSGNFADVYEVRSPANGDRWALKCFTREVRGLRERYAAVSSHLAQARLPFGVDFQFLEQGVRLRAQWFPVLKMRWVEGLPLNQFVRDNLERPALLDALSQVWLRMAQRLREASVAHGDIQHGNLLLVPSARGDSVSVKLIDYDGMYVPALAGSKSGEVGHPNYQHPQRLREQTYGPEVDRFPLLVVAAALRCLRVGGRRLWEPYDNGDNLLFRAADLVEPWRSPLFTELLALNDPEARDLVKRLMLAAQGPLEQTPLLEEVLAPPPAVRAALPDWVEDDQFSEPQFQQIPAVPPPLPPAEQPTLTPLPVEPRRMPLAIPLTVAGCLGAVLIGVVLALTSSDPGRTSALSPQGLAARAPGNTEAPNPPALPPVANPGDSRGNPRPDRTNPPDFATPANLDRPRPPRAPSTGFRPGLMTVLPPELAAEDPGDDLGVPSAKPTTPARPANPPRSPPPDKKDPEKPPEKPAPPEVDPATAAVEAAIDRGITHLRALQQADGSWPHAEAVMGATALPALTLLECGIRADDAAVTRAAHYVRQASIGCTHTYSLALGIVFLDRLGEAEDVPLIESMAVRLLGGQGASGGWTYNCPALSAPETRRLGEVVRRRREPGDRRDPPRPAEKRTVKDLHPEIQKQLAILAGQPAPDGTGNGDNSNTQFAALGLWVARRHGLPVDSALARIEARFRSSQNPNGGWGYVPATDKAVETTATMTCAGTFGLTVSHGAVAALVREGSTKVRPRDARKDPSLNAAVLAMSTFVGQPIGNRKDIALPKVEGKTFYFLWGLERVCVALDLKTLGRKDWHAWGTEILLANQQADGSWKGEFAVQGGADTCFALLFLKRSNLTSDLVLTPAGAN